MKEIESNRFADEKIIIIFSSVLLLALLYAIKTSASQFALLFPEGLYRYAATAFMAGVICVWLLIAFKPSLAVFLLLIILPVGARLSEFFALEIGDLVITADVLAIWVSVLISISAHGLRRDKLQVYFALFVALAVVSSIFNLDTLAPTIILCGIVTQVLFYALVVSVVKEMQEIKLIITALGFIVVSCSIFAFVQPFLADRVADYFFYRLPSVFYNPVIFANVITLLWPFTLIFEPFGSYRFPKLTLGFRVICVGVSLVALILTGSRGAIAVAGVQIIWLLSKFGVGSRDNPHYVRYITYFLILGLFIIAFLNTDFLLTTVLRRFYYIDFGESGSSGSERMLGALGGLELGMSHPFFGVGLGNFRYAYPFTNAAASGVEALESAHDFIINIFAEVGLFGVALWLLIIASSLRRVHFTKDWLYTNHEAGLNIVLKCSLFGFTAAQFLFYGEFLHKNVGLPMVLYLVVLGLTSSLFLMKRRDRGVRG